MADYIKWIRERVGHDPIILNAAGAIILNKNGEILLIKRGDRKEEVWGLPGGMMELGESVEETVKREVREETGLKVKTDRLFGVYTKPSLEIYPNGDQAQVIFFVFVCTLIGGNIQADGIEISDIRYFDPIKLPPGFRHPEIIRDYLDGQRGVIGNKKKASRRVLGATKSRSY